MIRLPFGVSREGQEAAGSNRFGKTKSRPIGLLFRVRLRTRVVRVTGFRNHGLRRLCDESFFYICANLTLAVPAMDGSSSFAAIEKEKDASCRKHPSLFGRSDWI